jgi:acyl dehydratase
VGTALTSSDVRDEAVQVATVRSTGQLPAQPRVRLLPSGEHQVTEAATVQFGRYFEEFEVGAVYKHWPGKTVTEYDDHLFCLLTMNHHPLHLDAHYAEETTDFGKNVVVGNYIYSLLLGMSVPDVSGKAIANLEVESLKHTKPTFHGDTIYGETQVLDKTESKSRDDRGVVHVETRGYKQDGTVVCTFRRKVMVPKRSYGDARGGEQPGRPVPC